MQGPIDEGVCVNEGTRFWFHINWQSRPCCGLELLCFVELVCIFTSLAVVFLLSFSFCIIFYWVLYLQFICSLWFWDCSISILKHFSSAWVLCVCLILIYVFKLNTYFWCSFLCAAQLCFCIHLHPSVTIFYIDLYYHRHVWFLIKIVLL